MATQGAPHITGMTPVRPLGTGGFSRVYLYEQDFPRRVTAVKVLSGDFRDPTARAAFTAEANALGRLSPHPSIVSLWAAGITTDGAPYLALEFCPGSLRERTRNRPAPLHEVLDIGVRLAGALASAHIAGLLHRDIKPSNVLITATGRPALSDFGISLLTQPAVPPATPGTTAHALTVPWSAPEVVTRQTTGTVASEVWALGATLYTFATGHSPFEHADAAQNRTDLMIRRITQGSYPQITAVEPQLGAPKSDAGALSAVNALLTRALSAQPAHRYASMREFGAALQRAQQLCGYPVTPIDIIEDGWAGERPAPVAPAEPAAGSGAAVFPTALTTPRPNSRAARRATLHPTTERAPAQPHRGTPQVTRLVGVVAGLTGLSGLALIAWWGAQNLGWL